jgi:hypothetical protein
VQLPGAPTCKGRRGVTGIIGKKVLVNLGSYTREEFLRKLSKNCSPALAYVVKVLELSVLKGAKVITCRGAHCLGSVLSTVSPARSVRSVD